MTDPIDRVIADRQQTHGQYPDTARTIQHLKGAMREGNNWAILSDMQRETLDMIQMKIGRILSGDPDHADHWDDITGYARLVAVPLHKARAEAARLGRIPATPDPAPDARAELERLARPSPRAVE